MSQGRTFKPDYVEWHYLARSNLHEPLSARGWISGSTCLPVTLALLLNHFAIGNYVNDVMMRQASSGTNVIQAYTLAVHINWVRNAYLAL